MGLNKLVSIESPYAGGSDSEVARSIAYARACVRDSMGRGEAPLAMHLLYTQPGILRDESPADRKLGMVLARCWWLKAGAVAVYSDLGMTQGMRSAISKARSIGMPVLYRELGEEWLAWYRSSIIEWRGW